MRPITERLTPVIKLLVIADTLLFAFYAVVKEARGFFNDHLVLSSAFFAGELWQPLTTLFVHIEPWSFIFNIIGLWWVGAAVERAIGRSRFLVLFFAPAVVANIGMIGLSLVGPAWRTDRFAGCGLAVLGLFVAFGKSYARTPARLFGTLALEARILAAILVGFSVVADLARASWACIIGDLLTVGLAYVLMGGRGDTLRGMWIRWRSHQRRRHIQVIDGGKGSSGSRYVN